MAADPQWVEISTGVSNFVEATALVVGGVWAYYKFARGRTLAWRLELGASGRLIGEGDRRAVRVTLSLCNPGLSIVRLSDVKQLRLYGLATNRWEPGFSVDWGERLALVEIFGQHDRVESQETVVEDALVLVPGAPAGAEWSAFRVDALVVGSHRRLRDSTQWTATAVVPAGAAHPDQEAGGER